MTMEEVKNKFITLKHHINRFPVDSDFELHSQILHLFTKPASAQIVFKNLFVSIDPCLINRMKTHHSSHDTLFATNSILPGQVSVCLRVILIKIVKIILIYSKFWNEFQLITINLMRLNYIKCS